MAVLVLRAKHYKGGRRQRTREEIGAGREQREPPARTGGLLSTGFGKSMIFTVFALAKEEMSSSKTCVIVISPLKSIIGDQISEMLSLSCMAKEETVNLLRGSPPQFSLLFGVRKDISCSFKRE